MAGNVTVMTVSSQTASSQTLTNIASNELKDPAHCRGPLDGSLYAKVNKNKKSEDGDANHVTEETLHESTNHESEAPNSVTNHTPEENEATNQKSPNVVVLHGNRIVYKPLPNLGFDPQNISAPLATLSEFNSSYLSLVSTRDSVPSLSSVTQLSITSSSTAKSYKKVEVNVGNMADGSIQQTTSRIVDDVTKKSPLTKAGFGAATKQNARFSEISSCSATTLSSTTTEEGGEPQPELSETDTSSDSSLSDHDRNLSPGTVKGNISPELLLEQALGDVEESEPPLFVESEIHEETEVEHPIPQRTPVVKEQFDIPPPPVAPPAVPQSLVGSSDQEVMYNGVNGNYNKGTEYAVPMRDMKITTIPSKRAVLVSTGNESDDMAAQTSDRRESVYDDGNAYSGAGYTTIEEYSGNGPIGVESPPAEDYSYIPEDVQELLNGLQEGPPSSDIDSGFHGSSIALQHSKITNNHNNVTSQSSSELSDPFSSPPPSQSNDASPTYDESYPVQKTYPRKSPVQAVSFATENFDQNMGQELKVQAVATTTPPRKNLNPGIPIPTQTMPEPQPAKVQIITMKNVYTNDTGVPLNFQAPFSSPVPNVSKHSNSVHTPTSGGQQQKLKNIPPAVAAGNSMETVAMRTKTSPMETVPLRKATVETATSPIKSDATMESDVDGDDVEDKLDSENIQSVDEQIIHAQKHLEFLKEQQEKLVKRKQDRTKHRESLKRNSSLLESHSQGYNMAPGVSATVPRKPYKPAEEAAPSATVKSQTLQKTSTPKARFQQYEKSMPPITNVEQRMAAAPVRQTPPSQNAWNATGPQFTRQPSDISHDRNGPVQPSLAAKKQPIRNQDEDDILMSSDLQEQLAELDKCIAELTISMDIPDADLTPQSTQEPPVVLRNRSYTLDIERKMDPNVPETNSNTSSAPNPPARSRSSFDSYKRLSQDFDCNEKRKSITDQGNDDVFTPGPQVPRKKKQTSPFPPQTSATRRLHTAPAPPPKRRMSLEERLSPRLMHALALNPGAKPKEDIHSYKEDLAPENNVPETPTFPLSPGTPYVNSDSPMRAKSPPGLAKTPLSALHLKPTEKPMESLHHVETRNEPTETRDSPMTPSQDVVDGKMFAPNNKQTLVSEPVVVQTVVAMPNGHYKETALLSDDNPMHVVSSTPKQKQVNAPPQYMLNGQNHTGYPLANNHATMPAKAVEVQREMSQQQKQQQPATPPSYLNLNLTQTTASPTNLNGIPQQRTVNVPEPTTPQQYLLNDSGRSHSSHSDSPAATSSNSRHGSSDSLHGPNTRHSNSSVMSSSSSSSAHHPGLPMASPNNVMRPGSQLSSYERHLLPPGVSGHRSGDESFGSPQSGRTSSSSASDAEKMNYDVSHATVSAAPKCIRDTTAFWYKPDITREQALAILRSKPAGAFVVRDSRCFPGAFGLALKVDKLPPNVQAKPGADIANEYVRHFLIETSSRGVKLKGCPNEPVFGSLSALVYQHSITALALPCRLIVPTADQEIPQPGNTPRQSQAQTPTATPSPANSVQDLLKQGAACNVIYIGSVDTESLTGPPAIERAVRETYQIAKSNLNLTSIVHFKVSPQGITLTDNARKIFFRRHYPTETVTFCGLDPLGGANKGQRRWDATPVRGGPDAWLFGFVARKQAGSRDNACHVFAELDPAQPARAIANFVMKILIGSTRQNSS